MLSPIPTNPAKAGKSQTDHIPATFLRTSMRAGTEVPWVQSHRNHQTGENRSQYPWGAIKAAQSCRAIATTFRVTSQLSNLHWPGVGISNKNKTILAQDVAYVKLSRVYLMTFRVNLCLIWNYFWNFTERGLRTVLSLESVSAFLTKAVQPAGMFHILSSLHNKARSGEAHWINTASVYHDFNGLSIIPKSTWHFCGSTIRYA